MTLHTQSFRILLFLIAGTAPFFLDSENFSLKEKNPAEMCIHFRDHGMRAVNCYGLELTEIPQNLTTNTEVCF
jgi:hypothetical protein